MLSIKKSLQPSPHIHSVVSSSKPRGKRNQSSSSTSTKFAEATGAHAVYKDTGIPLELMCKVPSQMAREVSRHRNHLTQVVVESHLPPKNVNQRHCTCLRHQEKESISDSKVLSSLKSRSSDSSVTKSNIYTINEKTDHDAWPIVRSINQVNLCSKCSMCNQSINSLPSGRSISHMGNYYSNERANRVSFASRTGENYDSEEITVIN